MSRGGARRTSQRSASWKQLELFGARDVVPAVPAPRPAGVPKPPPLRVERAPAPAGPCPVERWMAKLDPAGRVRLVWTDNRVVMASLGGTDDAPVLRIHRLFAAAPDRVAEALVRLYLRSPRKPRRQEFQRRLHEFIEAHEDAVPAAHTPPRVLAPRGTVHDLAPIWAAVRARWFPAELRVVLGWSPRPARRTLARWHEVTGTPNHVVVNRLLDDARVPVRVLEYLLYHEGLHEELRERDEGGRRVYHHAEFRRRERLFPDFAGVGLQSELLLERLWRWHRRRRNAAKRR